ncbi:HNH endonuclease signature motif containing protein [Leuconostoc mesenteroides]|uniref:HNH endonuclease signature motif containing protein n=1 Tax=Leuconostoc mesenteroides TaxID=1245 RepID=UPI0023631459|nr:HNH endonuclease signature motif containing protein [Leuconostoc mesenteroides]
MELPSLIMVFFNIDELPTGDFQIKSSFKESKFANMQYDKKTLFTEVAVNLTTYFNIPFEFDDSNIICQIQNDTDDSHEEVNKKLTAIIFSKLSSIMNEQTIDIDSLFLVSIFCLRGSVDFTAQFYTLDLKRDNESTQFISSVMRLCSMTDLPSYLNFNFRDLQPQYTAGENKRNSQLRVNLRYFWEKAGSEIKVINPYKYNQMFVNRTLIRAYPQNSKLSEFFDRISFYRGKILNKSLTSEETSQTRAALFNENQNSLTRRNYQVKIIVRDTTEDVCAGCNNIYNLDDRSFMQPSTHRYFFEYHHVISFANDKNQLDIPDNIVKLCPTCHRALSPHRSESIYQKNIIKNVLSSRDDVESFVETYLKVENREDTIERVYELLK